ncbi:MAG TPA: SBBP repeat-containing protein, partial [Candidatus Brocadiaceae bacterium]
SKDGNKETKGSGHMSGRSHLPTATAQDVISDSRQQELSPTVKESAMVKLLPLGANKNPEIIAEGMQESKVNYFIGNNPQKWKTNIPTYQSVVYKEMYKGIDIKFYGNNQQLEYDIIVKPGANPSHVKFSCEGIKGLRVTEHGELAVSLKDGKLIQKKPYIYQEIDGKRIEIEGKFRVASAGSGVHNPKSKIQNPKFMYGFQVAKYDRSQPLIIDPALAYSTYLGGSRNDSGHGIAVDTVGNAYVTGYTLSTNFPTAHAIQGSNAGSGDVFITKINADGSALVYSTYLGGGGTDSGHGIAVDTAGNAYVAGYTLSTNFPTAHALQGNNAGGTDAFITKLNADGSALVYSTYLGGGGTDSGHGIAVDTTGNAYVTGNTSSANFPTAHALQGNKAGNWDVFITKINPAGSALVYSTYLGGRDYDFNNGVVVDAAGNTYTTGFTYSDDFPTANALRESNAGDADAFVTKLNAAGSALVYSTYLGGHGDDDGAGIAVDTAGNVYVTGGTESTNFPTAHALQGSNAGDADAFVAKLNADGSALVYSTYLGGHNDDNGEGIAVDTAGNVYVTGGTESTNFPTAHALQGSNAGDADAFVAKLNADGSALVYSTYLGGHNDDNGEGIAVDTAGNAYITGDTDSTNFFTANAIQGSNAGGADAFVAKILFSMDNKPTVKTKTTRKLTDNSATLNGIVNAHGLTTRVWFQYGTTKGSYNANSPKKIAKGSTDKKVGIGVSGLTSQTKYYYRIAAENKDGTSYGDEMSFTTK